MKALRIVLAVLAGAVVLLFIVAVIVVRSFDLNDYKDEITAYVADRTGRTLAIDDDIEFSLFPWFAVETGGVSLSDDPAFGDRSFVTVDSLSARVRVWPLLKRNIQIGRVILDGINVNLGTDTDGRGNWTTLLETPAPEAPSAGAAEPGRPVINTLAVEGIELRNARILWHDRQGEVTHLARDLTLVTGPVNDDDPVELSLSLSLLDVATQASAAIELAAIAAVSPVIELSEIEAAIRLLDSRGQERAAATLGLDALALDAGVLRSGPAELAATFARPPVGPDRLELGARLLSFELDTETGSLVVNGLAASAGAVAASLNLSGVTMLSDPRLTGTVELRSETVAGLLEALGAGVPADLAPGGSAAASGGVAASARFDLGLASGTLVVERYTANLLGVEATGRAALAPDSGLSATIELAPFRPSEPLLALLGPRLPEAIDLRAISTASSSASLTRGAGSRGVNVTGLSITLDDARVEGRLSIDDLDAPTEIDGTLTATGLDNRLLGSLFGAWLPAPLVATNLGEFRLATSFVYEPASSTAAFAPLELTAYGLSGDGELTVAASGDALALSGRAALAEFSPRELLARFALPVPQTSDPTAFRSAEVAASFETTGSAGEFRDIAIELDDSRITGELDVSNFADPEYRFVLRADRIDADRYLPPRAAAGADAAPAAPPAAAAAVAGEKRLGDLRLASEPLTATNVTGSASVGSLRIGGMEFEQLSTDVAFGDGRAALSSVRTELYGGSFAGGLTIDATDAPSVVRLTGDLGDVAIEPLLTAMLGDASLSGTGNVDLDLAGSGETINDALASAAGQIGVAFTNGEIEGMNLGRRLCETVNSARGLPAPAGAPNATLYSVIRATATVSEGVASTSDIYAATGYLELTGRGGIRLVDQRIDTEHRASLTGSVPIAGCEDLNRTIANDPIPFNFTLKGSFPEIEVGLDISQLLQDWARREVRQGVRERVEDAILDRLLN
ncbi:MAG TPA: AsmA family protein [Gammaproteobacteria bacterium]|nr:AsmA family protein [Gammaproteobacteria bacterium]